MKKHNINSVEQGMGIFVLVCHFGMMLFGITAWLTGDAADDHKKYEHFWFTMHSWIGMGLVSSLSLYIVYCTFGPRESRFSNWVPCTKERLLMVRQDIAGLLMFRLPERPSHQGLAGLVQFFGVLIFAGMAVTGALMFFLLEPGSKARGLVHIIEEVHEAGEFLIPLYLSIHVGAVLLHSITGHPVWKRIFFFGKGELRCQ
jgi:cytochrome b